MGVICLETVVEEEKKCVCPNCGADMQESKDFGGNTYVCPECGCSIQADEHDYDAGGVCPNCNQLLEGNECPRCGYDLGSDFN